MASHTGKGLEVETTGEKEMAVSNLQLEVSRVADRLNGLLCGTRGWIPITSFDMTLTGDQTRMQALVRPNRWPQDSFFVCVIVGGHEGMWSAKEGNVDYSEDLSFDFGVVSSVGYMKLWRKRKRPAFR